MRICISGPPTAGKTYLAAKMGNLHDMTPLCTDVNIALGWSGAVEACAEWLRRPGPWIVEGVTVIRGLRRLMTLSELKPCDKLIWLPNPRWHLGIGQNRMKKGLETVFNDIKPELLRRNVAITEG